MSDPAITENTTLEIKHDEEEVLKETSIEIFLKRNFCNKVRKIIAVSKSKIIIGA